jgi:hypothetical protein
MVGSALLVRPLRLGVWVRGSTVAFGGELSASSRKAGARNPIVRCELEHALIQTNLLSGSQGAGLAIQRREQSGGCDVAVRDDRLCQRVETRTAEQHDPGPVGIGNRIARHANICSPMPLWHASATRATGLAIDWYQRVVRRSERAERSVASFRAPGCLERPEFI